ncbi:unnamed protein product [Prorocentrum cordatum]|uniref:Uncharacterized protein n=1 Tax=Prorocentrum cordatum TaxID=2364126 RepID=A0ABN9QI12_9DINO|nr:unnamed protein product [Polarella glacialis]
MLPRLRKNAWRGADQVFMRKEAEEEEEEEEEEVGASRRGRTKRKKKKKKKKKQKRHERKCLALRVDFFDPRWTHLPGALCAPGAAPGTPPEGLASDSSFELRDPSHNDRQRTKSFSSSATWRTVHKIGCFEASSEAK